MKDSTSVNTPAKNIIPQSQELISGWLAQQCYADKELRDKLRDDPFAYLSERCSELMEKPVDISRNFIGCKIHPLENTEKKWHIVLPIERSDTPPEGFLSEEDLEQVDAGAIFATIAGIFGITSTMAGLMSTVGYVAPIIAGLTMFFPEIGAGSVFIANSVMVATIASMVATGAIVTAGITMAAIGGMDAAGIINAL